MTTYLPAIIWILGAGIGYLLMQKRSVRISVLKNILVALLGPLSIPLAFIYKSEARQLKLSVTTDSYFIIRLFVNRVKSA